MKFRIKMFLVVVCFIVFGILLDNLLVDRYHFTPSRSRECWNAFYQLPDNSVDLAVIGSSHALLHTDPELFQQYSGLDTFVLASPGQGNIQSYFSLKEMFEYHNPSIVLVEVFPVYYDSPVDTGLNIRKTSNVDYMKFSKNKVDAVFALFEKEDFLAAWIPLLRDHNTWKDINVIYRNIIKPKDKDIQDYRGHFKYDAIFDESKLAQYRALKIEEVEIDQTHKYWLERISELCKENNAELVFFMSPWLPAYRDGMNYTSVYDFVNECAIENGVPYIDYNMLYEDAHFKYSDFANDAVDKNHHLNYMGSFKLTMDLLKRLELCTSLKLNSSYVRGYEESIYSLTNSLEAIEETKLKILISSGISDAALTHADQLVFDNLGLNYKVGERTLYCVILGNENDVIFEAKSENELKISQNIENGTINIPFTMDLKVSQDGGSILINDDKISFKKGITLLTLNKDNKVIDNSYFDTDLTNILFHYDTVEIK